MISRDARAAALERWADRVQPEMLRATEQEALEVIGLLVSRRDQAGREMAAWVARARELGCTWSQIGAELGVSKQAAQRKYRDAAPEMSPGVVGA